MENYWNVAIRKKGQVKHSSESKDWKVSGKVGKIIKSIIAREKFAISNCLVSVNFN